MRKIGKIITVGILASLAGGALSQAVSLENITQKLCPKTEREPRLNSAELSNGMIISGRLIRSTAPFNSGKIYVVAPDDLVGYDLVIFDENDGYPYTYQELNQYDKQGKALREPLSVEKRFHLTYEYGGTAYPIWEPTAFRSHAMYRSMQKDLNAQIEAEKR